MQIRTFVETVAIPEIATRRAEIETACFAQQESASLLRLQTLAGIVCVKRAVKAALASRTALAVVDEKDIVIGHDGQGAPIILELPAAACFRGKGHTLCISLSHTKNHACGCAVIEQEPDNA